MASAEKLAQTSNEEERKAVLDELAEMVREWDVNASLDNQLFAGHLCCLVPNLVPIFEQDAGDC